ncbi:hypothetical protein [Macrococcoides bohemicum]|uniref:hypothetical protein n=1 Tax=Macrococcoides bohemicum TaxID=1903056 RepID=UPI00165E9A62|nr:hypothetical protein [Macrococcus bohemicus]MBC9873678.1 hypothetical protein [Macrococcus bohemicus]
MLNIYDNITWENREWKVYHIDKENNTVRLQRTEDGTGIATVVDLRVLESDYYKRLYENEKQRTDELERRWKKLKEHFIKEKEQSFGILSWSRNNGMLELIEKLEEDGE